MAPINNPAGGFRFMVGGIPYSQGVCALAGFEIVRATLQRPIAYAQGFELIDGHLQGLGRPVAALCAIELRSPEPWTSEGFAAFNAVYRKQIDARGLPVGEHNPVARTNVAPALDPPTEPLLYAFSYTIPTTSSAGTFVISGAGDRSESGGIREGESSDDALREKADYVVGAVLKRLAGVEGKVEDITAIGVYSVFSPLAQVASILRPLGTAGIHAFHWCYSYPPVKGLDFELDVRSINQELRLRG